jgi:ribokinase
MESRIVVVGSITVEMSIKSQRFPIPGETVLASNFVVYPGGKGALQAMAAARLGGRVTLLGQVGPDMYGSEIKQKLASAGIDTTLIHTHSRTATGLTATLFNGYNQSQRVSVPGANDAFSVKQLEKHQACLASARVVLLQLDIPLATVMAAAEIAAQGGALVILDPSPPERMSDELLRRVNYLTPNEMDLAALTGAPLEDLPRALAVGKANELRARGARGVIVKLGLQGALLVTENLQHLWRPRVSHRGNVTTAGDVFNAALAVGLAGGRSELAAGRFAEMAATCAACPLGTPPSLPTREEVEKRLKERPRPSHRPAPSGPV